MHLYVRVVIIILLAFAWAQEANPLEVKLEAFIVSSITKDDGSTEELFSEAEAARPGQIVEYRITVQNSGETSLPANNAVITGPIPAGTEYLAETATASSALALLEFSADGGQSFSSPPIMMMVRNSEGQEEEVEAQAKDYTAARWSILKALEPAEMLVFVYRVVVK